MYQKSAASIFRVKNGVAVVTSQNKTKVKFAVLIDSFMKIFSIACTPI